MINNYQDYVSFTGTGGVATYAFPYKISNKNQILIQVFTIATGALVFSQTADVVNANVTSSAFDSILGGGSITLATNLPATQKIILKLSMESVLQESQFREQNDFKLRSFENALDALTTYVARLYEKSKRSISFSDQASNTVGLDTKIAQPVVNGIPIMNDAGTGFEMKNIGDIVREGGLTPDDGLFIPYDGYSARFGEFFSSISMQDTFDKILKITYTPPTISLGGSSNVLREKGASVSGITLTATVTKKSDPIAEVRFYQGVTLLDTKTGTIPAGGSENTVYAPAFTDNTSFSAQVDDNGDTGGPTTVTANTTYSFVYPYYYGAGAAGKTPAQVAALTKDIIVSTATKIVVFSASNTDVFYFAYPASYGALTSILDVNGFETIGAWTLTTSNITGLDATAQSYRIYAFNNPVVAGSYQYTFKR